MYTDSHAHLEMPQFDADRADMLSRAHAAGVTTVLAIGSGTGPGSLACAIELAESVATSPTPHPRILATIGIHPHEAKLATAADFVEMAELAQNPNVVAWGEIGLDYFYDHSPRDVQKSVFLRQMEQARAAKLPIIIHCRPSADTFNAWDDCLALIAEHFSPSGLGGILHCFAGTPDHARQAIALGFMISFAGNVTFPKAQPIRDAALSIPLDSMLIETDSPFLAPVPNRGQRNEPAFVVQTAKFLAELCGLTPENIAQLTTDNFFRFLSRHEKPLPPLIR